MLMIDIEIFLEKANYAHLNHGSINFVNMCATYQLRIIGT